MIEGGIMEASGRHLEAPSWMSGKHLGGIWEAAGRLLGAGVAMGAERQVGWKKRQKKTWCFTARVMRPSVSPARDESKCHQVR